MSLSFDQQVLTSLLAQSEIPLGAITDIVAADKRTIGKYLKAQGFMVTKEADPGPAKNERGRKNGKAHAPSGNGTAPENGNGDDGKKASTKEIPEHIHRAVQDFLKTRDLRQLCDTIDTLDLPATRLLFKHMALLLPTQTHGTPADDEEDGQ
jgi:hypothetical protein